MKYLRDVVFLVALPFCLLTISLPSAAQMCAYGDPSYGSSDCQIQRHGTNGYKANSNQAADHAEAQRQWQIREDAVQKEIAQLRATPSYGALAVSDIDSSMGGGFGYTTQEKATQHALNACKAGNCRILVTFFNTCAVVANSMGSKNSKTLIVALDPSPAQALNKALVQCEAKFGSGNCGVHNNGEAFCAGYDYGLYGK